MRRMCTLGRIESVLINWTVVKGDVLLLSRECS